LRQGASFQKREIRKVRLAHGWTKPPPLLHKRKALSRNLSVSPRLLKIIKQKSKRELAVHEYYFYYVFGRSVSTNSDQSSRLVCSRVFWFYRRLYRLASLPNLLAFTVSRYLMINVTDIRLVGSAHPTVNQGFWRFAKVNCSLIQCYSFNDGGSERITWIATDGIKGVVLGHQG
jgi:hypothetical protein